MEPSTTPDYSGESAVKTVTKSNLLMICDPLCHPTSVSKILAAVLFIILPFIGAWIGYQMGQLQIEEVPAPIIRSVETVPENENVDQGMYDATTTTTTISSTSTATSSPVTATTTTTSTTSVDETTEVIN